ncbi:MAG: hypothetical protein IT531_07525 [Burkholderiales bacterium]|nr:hypothetical protein [Burkholderiales bacterium]
MAMTTPTLAMPYVDALGRHDHCSARLRIGCSLSAALLGFAVAAEALAANPGTIFFDSELQFRSSEQSVWGSDAATFLAPIHLPIATLNQPSINVGGIQTRQVNNPLHDGWQVLYDSTYASTYGTVFTANFSNPFGGCFGNATCAAAAARSAATSAARSVAGPEPARTYAERNGGRLTGDTKLLAGLTGAFEANGGTVHVDYLPRVRTTLGNAGAAPGARMTLQSPVTHDNARITTSDIGVRMSLAAYQDFASHLTLEAYLLNVGGPATLTNFGDGYKEKPLYDFIAGNGTVTLDPLGLGTPLSLPDTLTKQFGVTVSPPDQTVEITAPVFEITVGVPNTSTVPSNTVKQGNVWRNAIAPASRTGAGALGMGNVRPLQGTEFARVALDMDSVSLMLGYPLGARAAVNTPPLGIPTILGAEGNILDFDLETFWALRSNYQFTPKLRVSYHFSAPVEVEQADGTRVVMDTITVGPDEMVTFLRPAGGVDIATAFSLDGSEFLNMTDFQVQFALSLALMELAFDGVLFSVADAGLTWAEIVDLPNRLFLANFGLDLGNPIQLGRIGSPQGVEFGLDGFALQAGPSFQIAAVPEPERWLLMVAGVAFVAGAACRRKLRCRVVAR